MKNIRFESLISSSCNERKEVENNQKKNNNDGDIDKIMKGCSSNRICFHRLHFSEYQQMENCKPLSHWKIRITVVVSACFFFSSLVLSNLFSSNDSTVPICPHLTNQNYCSTIDWKTRIYLSWTFFRYFERFDGFSRSYFNQLIFIGVSNW